MYPIHNSAADIIRDVMVVNDDVILTDGASY